MRLTYLSNLNEPKAEPTDDHQAIYVLQTIEVDQQQYTLFYDNGCKNSVIKFDATKRLGGNRAKQIIASPIPVGGVGGVTTQSTHGIYTFSLPLATNNDAEMTGVCLDTLTATFPLYPLQGKVENDIQHNLKDSGHDINQLPLPRLPPMVGGDIDVMIGIHYLRYFPKFVHQLPSGLTIYQSQFKNVDGTYGVIGGPHEVFTRIENQHHSASSQPANFKQPSSVSTLTQIFDSWDLRHTMKSDTTCISLIIHSTNQTIKINHQHRTSSNSMKNSNPSGPTSTTVASPVETAKHARIIQLRIR